MNNIISLFLNKKILVFILNLLKRIIHASQTRLCGGATFYGINKNYKTIVFILDDDDTIHYGDLLFFIPTINYLEKQGNTIYLITSPKKDAILNYLDKKNIHLSSSFENIKSLLDKNSTLIVTTPNLFRYKHFSVIRIGYLKSYYGFPYPAYIFKTVLKAINKTYENIDYIKSVEELKKNLARNVKKFSILNDVIPTKPFIIVSPSIESGKILFITKYQQRIIIRDALNYGIKKNYLVVIVGNEKDYGLPKSKYIKDLRGSRFEGVLSLLNANYLKTVYSFDNVWMLMSGLHNFKCNVYPRFRFYNQENLKKKLLYI